MAAGSLHTDTPGHMVTCAVGLPGEPGARTGATGTQPVKLAAFCARTKNDR
jgi:hypothetical protein